MEQRAGSRNMACLAVCAVLMATLAWTSPARADTCLGSGSITKCTLDSQCCSGLVCNKRCQRGCKIGGVFYDNGTKNPANDCQSCQALVSRFGWTNLAASTACGGAPVGVCDAQNTCNGSGACIENYEPSSTVCRSSAGVCDVVENCTGSSKTCPTDSFLPGTTVCRSSAGVCDTAESCTGSAAACPADAFLPSSTVCRSSGGVCDVAESCTGSAAACPTDAVEPSATVCRSSAGVCDVAEHCTGTAKACPGDVFQSSATVCRSSAGVCDVAENCTGSAAAYPADGFQLSATVCRSSAGVCDIAESCTGSAAACPADGFQSSATVCRSAAGVCDVAESCTGSTATCPGDGVAPTSTVCRPADGSCDVAEHCDGTSHYCPADAFAPSTQLAFPTRGVCDSPDFCPGSSKLIPLDVTNAGSECRASTGPCDPAEICQLGSDDCPTDVKTPASTDCSASVSAPAACELWTCNGTDGTCHQSGLQSSGHPCRPRGTNDCDITERCDGTSSECPADAFFPDGTRCSTVIPKPNPDPNPAAHCLANVCLPIPCKYGIECPDGYVCDTVSTDGTFHQCVPAPTDHGFGDSCTGQSGNDHGDCVGFLCCAGMAGDGNGAVAGSGVHGRCADCCAEVSDDCGGGATCCDGQCTDVTSDPHNCLGCAYSPGGIDCDTLINACQPSVIKCDETIGSGCVMQNNTSILSCDYAAGDSCTIGTETVANPNCNYCDFFSASPGAGCLTDADCEIAPGLGTCHHVYGRCADGAECDGVSACADGSGCWAWTCFLNGTYDRITDDCRTPPYTFCQVGCTHYEAPANPGTKCDVDTDCTGGTTCKSSCGDLYITKGAFCFSDNTCQY